MFSFDELYKAVINIELAFLKLETTMLLAQKWVETFGEVAAVMDEQEVVFSSVAEPDQRQKAQQRSREDLQQKRRELRRRKG